MGDAYRDSLAFLYGRLNYERVGMPRLARAACLRFLLTRAYDWLNRPPGAIVTPHDPRDYVARLAFHRACTSIADYGGATG